MLHPDPEQRPSVDQLLKTFLATDEEKELLHLRKRNQRLEFVASN